MRKRVRLTNEMIKCSIRGCNRKGVRILGFKDHNRSFRLCAVHSERLSKGVREAYSDKTVHAGISYYDDVLVY